MKPVLNDPPRQRKETGSAFATLEEISETSDIITFHVPLNRQGIDKTFHLADMKFFFGLKKKPFIINTSRGEVVETEAVKAALAKGMISGFVADVWENEPYPDPALLQASIVATPHIAGYSVEGKANGTAACVRAASQFFGFGLDNWYPPALPPPAQSEIHIDGTGKTGEQIITEAILATYDVMNDDFVFRNNPSLFEDLRNHYGIRREFEVFCVNVRNARPDIIMRLKELGFQLLNIEVRRQKAEDR
jgi:erythronate-4-phosphate dehydrogenase